MSWVLIITNKVRNLKKYSRKQIAENREGFIVPHLDSPLLIIYIGTFLKMKYKRNKANLPHVNRLPNTQNVWGKCQVLFKRISSKKPFHTCLENLNKISCNSVTLFSTEEHNGVEDNQVAESVIE